MEMICDKDLSNVTGGTRAYFTEAMKGIKCGAIVGGIVGFYNGIEKFRNSVSENSNATSSLCGVITIPLETALHALRRGIIGAGIGFILGALKDATDGVDLSEE